MRKPILALALLSVIVGSACLWFLYRLSHRPSHSNIELRAMMRDEDAPRPIEPSVGLQVNDGHSAEVASGTPVWFTFTVDNAAAQNELSAAQAIAERLIHMSPTAPGRARLEADYQRRATPAKITLGDAAHPWIEAVQLLVRDAQGAERPLNFPVPPVGKPAPVVSLDAFTSEQASFGSPAATASPGAYSVISCLGQTRLLARPGLLGAGATDRPGASGAPGAGSAIDPGPAGRPFCPARRRRAGPGASGTQTDRRRCRRRRGPPVFGRVALLAKPLDGGAVGVHHGARQLPQQPSRRHRAAALPRRPHQPDPESA